MVDSVLNTNNVIQILYNNDVPSIYWFVNRDPLMDRKLEMEKALQNTAINVRWPFYKLECISFLKLF